MKRRRLMRDVEKVATEADPQALNRLIEAGARDLLDSYFTRDADAFNLALAWRTRAMEITKDLGDLDPAIAVFERIADGSPEVQAELAATLLIKATSARVPAEMQRAIELIEAAFRSAPTNPRVKAIYDALSENRAAINETIDEYRLRVHPTITSDDGAYAATVYVGMFRDALRYLVFVNSVEAASSEAEEHDTKVDALRFFDVWRQAPQPDAEVLVVLNWGDEWGLFDYSRPVGMDERALAADVLLAFGRPLRLRGPYWLAGTLARAFVIVGHYAGRSRRVAIVTMSETAMESQEVQQIFLNQMETRDVGDLGWVVVDPAPTSARENRSVPELMTRGLENLTTSEFGEAVLEFATHHRRAGLTYIWQSPHALGYQYAVRRSESEPFGKVITTGPWPPSDESVDKDAETWDARQEMHALRYAQDALSALEQSENDDRMLIAAFDEFAFHVRLVQPKTAEDAQATVWLGLRLAESLTDVRFGYAAEWVATRCAPIAAQWGLHDEQRALLRLAAMAAEALGLFDVALDYYDRAFEVREAFNDPWLHRSLYLSAATTCVDMFSAHEPEGLHASPLRQVDAERIRTALDRLDVAERLVASAPAGETSWARMAIATHRWRLRDLLGEHELAAEGLGSLLTEPELAEHAQLRISTYLFYLAAVSKMDNGGLREALRQSGQFGDAWGVDRRVIFCAMLADNELEAGEAFGAFLAAEEAHELQIQAADRDGRTPQPGENFNGEGAIDTLARMCRAWSSVHRSGTVPEFEVMMLFRALRWRIESAKSRWLSRDLVEPVAQIEDLDERLGTWGDRMRAGLSARDVTAVRQFDSDQVRRLTQLAQDEKITELRGKLPEGTALMSFYESKDFTFVSCVTPETGVFLELPVSRVDLSTAVQYLQAGFSGSAMVAPIDPDRPHEIPDRYVHRILDLSELLAPVVAAVRDSPLLVIAPHGAWHNIPIHALLLPQIWDTGRNPALSYVPSLVAGNQLFDADAQPPQQAAVVAYPRRPQEEQLFQHSHERTVGALQAAVPAIDDLFGRDATPSEVLSMAGRSELLHVLAHGFSAPGKDVMHSGLALSPGSGPSAGGLLTASRLGQAPIQGSHLTLQACSIGRVVTASSDELWGPARAALLAGARSVLAPMWNADLHSSTHLLTHFYRLWVVEAKSKAQALTEAQRRMYQDTGADAWKHFYHWAAFKLMGA